MSNDEEDVHRAKRQRSDQGEARPVDTTTCSDAQGESAVSDEPIRLKPSDFVLGGEQVVHPTNVPVKPDSNLRWIERIASYYQPTASFFFEVTYPAQCKEPGFEYQWQFMPFAGHCFNRWLLYCVVTKVHYPFSNILTAGDVVLRVNEDALLFKRHEGDAVHDKALASKLQDALRASKSHTIIRVFRNASHTQNTAPSPAELQAVLSEKACLNRFLVKIFNKGDGTLVASLEMNSTDPQAPSTVKKVMQGMKIQWQLTPLLAAAPVTAMNQATVQNAQYFSAPIQVHQAELPEPAVKEGVVKEGRKFVAYFSDIAHPGRVYHLGAFDREDDAVRAYNKALQSMRICGKFNMRHHLLNYGRQAMDVPAQHHAMPDASSMFAAQGVMAPNGAIDYTSMLNT